MDVFIFVNVNVFRFVNDLNCDNRVNSSVTRPQCQLFKKSMSIPPAIALLMSGGKRLILTVLEVRY